MVRCNPVRSFRKAIIVCLSLNVGISLETIHHDEDDVRVSIKAMSAGSVTPNLEVYRFSFLCEQASTTRKTIIRLSLANTLDRNDVYHDG